MQVYDSLAMEANLEVREAVLDRCKVFPASAPKNQTHSLQWVLLGEDFVRFPLLVKWGVADSIPGRTDFKRAWNGLGISLHGFSAQP